MHLMKKIFLLAILLSSQVLHAEPLRGNTAASPLVAVGQTDFPDGATPLILVSEDNGTKWTSVASPDVDGRFVSVACTGNQCTAIGDGAYDDHPLIYTSSDAKRSWQINKNIFGLPADLSSATLSSLNCSGNICIAIGTGAIVPKNESVFPIVLRSEDTGKTWKYIPTPYPRNFLFHTAQISFSGTNCVIAGTVWKEEDGLYYPLILTSHDLGRSWSLVTKIENLPAKQNNLLMNVSCDGSNCVAVGMEANLQAKEIKPLFIYSNDAGQTWSYSNSVQSNMVGAGAFSVNCTGTFCIAGGGRDYVNSPNNASLIWTSKDSGKSWTSPSISGAPLTFVSSTQCEGSSCVAMNTFPAFVATSQDQGLSWKKAEISDPLGLLHIASLSSLSCAGNDCNITGVYYAMAVFRPFFLLSHDHGMTWQFNQNIAWLTELNYFPISLTGSKGEFPIRYFGPDNNDWMKRYVKVPRIEK